MTLDPFFDWCSILLTSKPIPPKQRKSGRKNKEFEEIVSIIHSLDTDKKWYPQNEWPWSERLCVVLAFSGPKEYLENCDIDNLSKAALDAFKGIAYVDDRQIDYLIAFKRQKPVDWLPSDKPALTIGIKKIQADFQLTTVPRFFVPSDKDDLSKKPSQIFTRVNGKTSQINLDSPITDKDFDKIREMIIGK